MEIYSLIFSPIDVNTYILADPSGECAIIDCGCYDTREFSLLKDFIAEKNLKPVLLLNTHCHLDHIFGSRLLLAEYNLGAFCHRDEEQNRKNAATHAMFFGLKMENPPEPAGFINDGEIIKFGGTELMALHVPGHSRGSLAFYSIKDSAVFTGDALFSGSIGRTDLPGGNYETLINSIKTRLFTLPPHTVVYPGHGDATTIMTEMSTNPYFSRS